ncbi:sporulation protein [Micromonospora sp. FIMYZ51]|uniref:sporulation protein n=1 Tax=Micromonospora sp. FIMYZ51 TaxID=3051832 RepID=UPI00311FC432
MVFKKMLGAFGIGAPSVDTVLSNPNTRPGLTLDGQVNLTGGSQDADIDQIVLGLVTRVEVDGAEADHDASVEFHRVPVASGLRLAQGQQLAIPFQLPIPLQTPVTDIYGQRLPGMTLGLRTEVAIRGAVDKGDLDPVHVHPLPVQERILTAFGQLGFRFKSADLEHGYIAGAHQTLPFYQEIEYFAAPQYAHGVNQVELTFLADEQGVEIVLEFDRQTGLFMGSHDSYGRYRVAHADADGLDWAAEVDRWLREALQQYQTQHPGYGAPTGHRGPAGYGAPMGYPPHQPGYGHYEEHHERRGSGMGAVAAGVVGGAALGFAGGMVAEEVFDSFGGDEGEDGGEE